MANIAPPPFHISIQGQNGKMPEVWQRSLLDAYNNINVGAAPADSPLITFENSNDLTNAFNLANLTTGLLRLTTAAGVATPSTWLPTFTQSSPGNPSGTTDTGGKMMGLAGTITPTFTGRVLITITGTIFNPTAIADGGKVQIRTGAGTAPSNGDALTGTAVGSLVQYVTATIAEKAPFSLTAIVSGLTLHTARWIDVGLAAITGGTATITDLTITALEV